MAMVVKNNMTAVNTLNILNKNSSALSKSLQKVSSGMKINSAADDASGYAISERMRVQIRSLDQANQNTQNGSSMMKVAEGAVSSTVEILKTLKEKAVNAANDSNTDSDRQTIQKELDQSIDQINDNANVTFNGKYLVDGSKNTIGNATYTALSNQSLAKDTKATTELTKLAARNGDSLEIHKTDKVTVSYVQGGKTYSTTFQVGDKTLQDIFIAAEDIDKESEIFAAADNKSITTAQVNDKVIDQAKADSMASIVKDAKTNYQNEKKDYDAEVKKLGALDSSTSDAGKVKAQVEAWNVAVAKWTSVQSADTTSIATKGIEVSEGDYTDAGEYLDAVAKDVNYNKIAKDLTDDTSKIDAEAGKIAGTGSATAQVAASTGTTVDALIDDVAAKLGTGSFNAAVKSALVALKDGNTTSTAKEMSEAKDKIYEVLNAANDLVVAGQALKAGATTALVSDGNKVTFTGGNYATYDAARGGATTGYVKAKNEYNKYAAPQLLEGKTVGVAASDDVVTTASGDNAITITANTAGIKGQISGFNISITDSEGNVKKSANAALDAFEETVRAQNKSEDNAISLQVGAKANQAIKVGLTDMRAEALGLMGEDGTKLNISTQTKANAAINVLDNAIQKALDQQTTIGSVESRLEYTSSNLTTASENVQASESTIRDADMAKEMTEYTKNNVLLQAAQSMLAQANQSSSNVLSLLQ